MVNMLKAETVAIYHDESIVNYYIDPPFHPSKNYLEYPFHGKISSKNNDIYDAVRNSLILLGLDKENIGTALWNPLKSIVDPGERVVIKPNFVLDEHRSGGNIDCVITQPAVIRAICDYIYIALKGKGEIIVADAPQADCNFDRLLAETRVETICEFYKSEIGYDIPIYDLRQLRVANYYDPDSYIVSDGDPIGYTIVKMNKNSSFSNIANSNRIYGADFDRSETEKHHSQDTHEYCVSKIILSANVIISIPKMKVHRKAGVTLNLKNFVGINGNKNYIPHYRIGLPADGGDEFPELNRVHKTLMYSNRKLIDILLKNKKKITFGLYNSGVFFYKMLCKLFPKIGIKDVIKAGDWYGNDTIWRTILDLNKILLYTDKEGSFHETPQRKFFCLVDGIVGGEDEGPLIPTRKPCGVIAAGVNPLIVDAALACIMGFSIDKIPQLSHAFDLKNYVISNVGKSDIKIKSNNVRFQNVLNDKSDPCLAFRPSKGWVGHIEV
jgi:uncharacterized protein (DUF362 family)